jgi:hypothetical protein
VRTIEQIWEAAATLLWVLPLLLFAATHARTAPPAPAAALVTLLVAAGIALPRSLGERYFRTRHWERDGTLYRALGVRRFGRWAPRGAVMQRIARRHAAGSTRGTRATTPRSPATHAAGRHALGDATRASERTHVWWLFMTGALIVWAGAIGAWPAAALLIAVNIAFNVYPILLQRETRARLQRVARRDAGPDRPAAR